MPDKEEACVQETTGPILEDTGKSMEEQTKLKEVVMEIARVGRKAPDFEATAFHNGTFKNFKLSELMGKWIVVCFYPGDFTFV